MGHRANYVLVERGKVEVGYSHWGALTIPDDLLYGPEAVVALARKLEPRPLMDNVWCEGIVLVDMDRRVVLFDGISDLLDTPLVRRLAYPLLCASWPGWELFAAPRDVLDVAEYLGLTAEAIGALDELSRCKVDHGDDEDWDPPDAAEVEAALEHPTLVELRDAEGTLRLVHLPLAGSRLLADGPQGAFVRLAQAAPARDLARLRSCVVRIDVPRKELRVWHDIPEYGTLARIATAWPGWQVSAAVAEEVAHLSGEWSEAVAEDGLRQVRKIVHDDKGGRILTWVGEIVAEYQGKEGVQFAPGFQSYPRPEPPATS